MMIDFKRQKRRFYGRFIDLTIDPKFLTLMKVYQASLWICTLNLILSHYDNVDENYILMFGIGVFFNLLLWMMQLETPVRHPKRSEDLVTVLVVIMAQILSLFINIVTLAAVHHAPHRDLFEADESEGMRKYLIKTGQPLEEERLFFYNLPDEQERERVYRWMKILFWCELAHHVWWTVYLWVRFCPDR